MFLNHDYVKMLTHFFSSSTGGFYTMNIKSGNFKSECKVKKHDRIQDFVIQYNVCLGINSRT